MSESKSQDDKKDREKDREKDKDRERNKRDLKTKRVRKLDTVFTTATTSLNYTPTHTKTTDRHRNRSDDLKSLVDALQHTTTTAGVTTSGGGVGSGSDESSSREHGSISSNSSMVSPNSSKETEGVATSPRQLVRSTSDRNVRDVDDERSVREDKYQTVVVRSGSKPNRKGGGVVGINNLFDLTKKETTTTTTTTRSRVGTGQTESKTVSAIVNHIKNFAPSDFNLKSVDELNSLKELIAYELYRDTDSSATDFFRAKSQKVVRSKKLTFGKTMGSKAERIIHMSNMRNTLCPLISNTVLSFVKASHQLARYEISNNTHYFTIDPKESNLYKLFLENATNV